MKLVTTAEMRAIEEEAFASGVSQTQLMENAGRTVAIAVRERMGNVRARRIVVLVGPGNNGGDGLVAARYFADFGAEVHVYLLTRRSADDPNLQAVRSRDIEVVEADDDAGGRRLDDALLHAEAVIDAVLGAGRQRPLEGAIAAALERVKRHRGALFALDLPTGLDPDSGAVDPHAAVADVTLTLGFSKVGLHLLPGSEYAGEVQVIDIGLDAAAADSIKTELLTDAWARAALPKRPLESNKGTFGRVLVVAGSHAYTGAPALVCLGALRAGAGLVALASVAPARAAVGALLPEATYLPLPEDGEDLAPTAGDVITRALPNYDALVIGPGLGQSEGAQALVRGVLTSPAVDSLPVVIDADALNALARMRGWEDAIRCRAVLTPHPGELARLQARSIASVQQDRLTTARSSAAAWRQTVILKGAHTIVARPAGEALVSPFSNALLATGGTGDVLAGVIAGLLAQDVEPFTAAGAGVYLHGAAAETYADEYGSSGLLASELGAGVARVAAKLRRRE